MLPILYSFKRCPYAMRARISLCIKRVDYIVREVDLKNKPEELLKISPKGTVPVLQLEDKVIDESLMVLLWLYPDTNQKFFLATMQDFQKNFTTNLNYFKYYDKHAPEQSLEHYQKILEDILISYTYNFDEIIAIAKYPFIRQARIANSAWFSAINNPDLHNWMAQWDRFLIDNNIMQTHKNWQIGDKITLINNNCIVNPK